MTEIVCIYQEKNVSLYTADDKNGYEQFNYRGSSTIPHRVFEEDTSDIANYISKKIRRSSSITIVFDVRTEATDKLAELLGDNYKLKTNFYDLIKLKTHLEKIDILAELSVQKEEIEKCMNEIKPLKIKLKKQLEVNEKSSLDNLKENDALKAKVVSDQKHINELNNKIKDMNFSVELKTLENKRRIFNGADLIADNLLRSADNSRQFSGFFHRYGLYSIKPELKLANTRFLWVITSGSILNADLLSNDGELDLGRAMFKESRDGEIHEKKICLDREYIGKKIILVKNHQSEFVDYCTQFRKMVFAIICEPKDMEKDVLKWLKRVS